MQEEHLTNMIRVRVRLFKQVNSLLYLFKDIVDTLKVQISFGNVNIVIVYPDNWQKVKV